MKTPTINSNDNVPSSLPEQKFSFGKTEIQIEHQKDSTIANPKSPKQIPKQLDQYKVIKICGIGFYSKVYLCSNENSFNSNSLYAIKTLKKIHINNNKAHSHLQSERNFLFSISHKFIIPILKEFTITDRLYIVYPYYNLDIFSLINLTNKQIPENIIKIILYQVYLAISFLHENNIVYRDLKPENILLDIDNGCIKLIDFGMAVKLNDNNMELSEICGTNEYIPPEVINKCSYGKEFDYWTFGILAYELLYGVPPFRGKDQKEIFKHIIQKEIDFPQSRDISEEIEDLIECLLRKDKSERMDWENVPYHPFFNGIDFEYTKEGTKEKQNFVMSEFLEKYKSYSIVVIDN